MGSLTITTTSAQDTRIVSAFGKQLNLVDENEDPRDATSAEVKAYVKEFIVSIVLRQEQREAAQIASDAVTEIEPT